MMSLDPMIMVLTVASLCIVISFWRAHRNQAFTFDAFDLVMENGKVSKIAVAFMLVLGVTTWVIIDQQIAGKLTEGMFGLYGGMWVMPLVAKVVFAKTEMPSTTTVASMTTTTTVQEPAP
jgi:hypothetical protein